MLLNVQYQHALVHFSDIWEESFQLIAESLR